VIDIVSSLDTNAASSDACKAVSSKSRCSAPRRILASALLAVLTVCVPLCTANASSDVDTGTREALLAAIADENGAEAYYRAVIERFGQVAPFANIVGAEQRHAAELEQLCRKYGVEVPPRASQTTMAVPDTLAAACGAAVAAEERNIAMYDGLLAKVEQPEVRQTFERLRAASRDRHLPAFSRCAGTAESSQAGVQADSPTCGSCGMGAACGCANASAAEKKARAAAGGGCGCAKARQQALGKD